MKKTIILSLASAFIISAFAFIPHNGIQVGSKAPKTDVEMMDISDQNITLADVAKENGLLVMFSCNTCPYVLAWEDRYPTIAQLCESQKIGFVLVNSNEAKRNSDDSLEKMKEHAKEKGYDFHYAIDKNHEIADAFGATRTPETFLFNGDMVLAYTGAIDDNRKDRKEVEDRYLLTAIKSMLAGHEINPNSTKSIGCTIKRLK